MKKLKICCIAMLWVCFSAGMFIHYIESVLLQSLVASIPAVCVVILYIVYYRITQQRNVKDQELLGETLTQRTEQGYTLDASKLYEAIEKLGYYEHERRDKECQ